MQLLTSHMGCLRWLLIIAGVAVFGCSTDSGDGASYGAVERHAHQAPLGGAIVELGEEEFHLEFVYAPPDRLQVYVLDGHMENYVRLSLASFMARAEIGGQQRTLNFSAIENTDTGERVGDSALFEARAPWLAPQPALRLELASLNVNGNTYADIAAEIPAHAGDRHAS